MGRRPLTTLVALVLVCLGCPRTGSAIKNETVCKNVDIRNTVQNFKKLENCTVIEGYLQILLIDNGQAQDYEGLYYPDLVEITGYLLLYRAFGLNSVGRIFPNLSVIRGNVLFHNYAFVIYEMYHLQEIALYHLTDILRGSVRIEKNPGLCYVDTIDWDLIAKAGKGGHFIKFNKKNDECPNTCPVSGICPNSSRDGKLFPLCWNSQHCQKVCSVKCEKNATCSAADGFCCQQECLGGCYGTTAYDCVACKHVLFDGKCLKKCPPGTFELINRRCVQELECRNYDEKESSNGKIFWKPFKGQCIPECPPGYITPDDEPHICKECLGECPKICKGMVVDHVSAAQKVHGCTVINGSLEIHIQGGVNVIKELEEHMNLVQEIHGYLKIARSFPLVSLNFLKSLRVIHGDQLDKKNYSFLVLDNQNLQELWNWPSRKERLQILKGKIFFHFNSKLCLSKIQELKMHADVAEWDDRDVSPSSNGDRVACDVTNMNVSVYSLSPSTVNVKWDSFQRHLFDERSLLGYVIYYREALYKNITMFEGRDACGTDAWTVRDVEISDMAKSFITHVINGLKPYTQYALYIRTYTTASGRQGAQSSIVYFKTEPDTPSPPVNIKASSTLHGEIVISWDPPKTPNGNVTHYIVEGLHDEDLSGLLNQRNYCSEPIAYTDYKKTYDDSIPYKHIPGANEMNSTTPDPNEESECCSCSNDHYTVNYDDDEAEFQIHFEDFLQNKLYVKNPNVYRRRRHVNFLHRIERSVFTDSNVNNLSGLSTSHPFEGDRYVNGVLYQFKRFVYHRPFLVVSNLKHFTEYTIEIQACQDSIPKLKSDIKSEPCSAKAITSVRTLALDGADDIRSSSLHVQTENLTQYSGFVKWEEPKDPNGVIVAYIIEYHRLDGEYFKPNRICLTRSNYLQYNGYYLSELPPGNYSLRVKANSLAKYGNWTSLVYFNIPTVAENSSLHIILIVTVLLFVALILSSMYGVYKWKLSPRIPDYVDYASVNPEYMSSNLVYEPDEWEIPREKIKLLEELGQGSFGMVYKGEVQDMNGNPFTPCAAKTVNESATLRERIEFLQEASVMKAFNCNHVIKLLGVVSKGQPTLVIMELMTNGDLKSYLRSHRPDSEENPGQQPPTLRQILQMASEIADGMAYLAAKKFVHRDLAARNCMVADDLTVKIGDFGMTRDVYETDYYRKGGKGLLPVRWMAPESLKDGIFDSQTDVWSFGVVLWEMATLASQPYQGLSNEDVLKFVISGNTMVKPEDCPEQLFLMMSMCWHKNPKARPTFVEIIEMLLSDVSPKFHHSSYYFTQHISSSVDAEDSATPTTPLRSSVRDEDNDQNAYRYFPSATQLPEENSNIESSDITEAQTLSSNYVASAANSNEGSKGVSVNYSDGSKGSKISNISNGSCANGHITLNLGRATEC